MCIEEFQQQRKSAETPGQLSQKLLRKLFQQLSDSPSFKRSFGYLTRMVIAVAEDPRLAHRTARQRCRKQGGQMPTAPEPILINRFESQWIQRRLINGISPCPHPGSRPRHQLACRRLKIAQGKKWEHLCGRRLTGKAAVLGP